MNTKVRVGLTIVFTFGLYFIAAGFPINDNGFGGSVASAAYKSGSITSCYKCHVKKKKAEYGEESIWHKQHNKVQASCPGCHGGKPWSKSKKSAHKNMRIKPMQDTASSCESCHMEGIPEKSNEYKSSSYLGTVRLVELSLKLHGKV